MTVKRDVLRKYSLQAGEVNRAVTAALAGEIVGQIVDGNRRFDIAVRMPEQLRADDNEIKKLPLRVGDSGMLPLGQVVEFSTLKTVEPIQRDEGQRRAALMVNLKTHDIEGYVRAAEQTIHQQVKLPEGYLVEFGGQFENLQQARARLAVVVPTALALIFMLIFLTFHSLRQALLVYSGIPLAMTVEWRRCGCATCRSASRRRSDSSRSLACGAERRRASQLFQSTARGRKERARRGARRFAHTIAPGADDGRRCFTRLRPMAIATGAARKCNVPLATVVIGGILSSTFLTVVLLPVLYEWVERKREPTR
jgi:cobalt-zinc-cadmium resistance protein CzcA